MANKKLILSEFSQTITSKLRLTSKLPQCKIAVWYFSLSRTCMNVSQQNSYFLSFRTVQKNFSYFVFFCDIISSHKWRTKGTKKIFVHVERLRSFRLCPIWSNRNELPKCVEIIFRTHAAYVPMQLFRIININFQCLSLAKLWRRLWSVAHNTFWWIKFLPKIVIFVILDMFIIIILVFYLFVLMFMSHSFKFNFLLLNTTLWYGCCGLRYALSRSYTKPSLIIY